jgi:SnoaL-like protein
MSPVVERLHEAMNKHDLEAFLECFHLDYRSRQPTHPTGASAAKNRSVKTGQASSRASQTFERSCSDTQPTATRWGASGISLGRG